MTYVTALHSVFLMQIFKKNEIRVLSMNRGEKTEFILRQLKKKNKRLVNKDLFTEFFYLNRNRKAIEFLESNGTLVMEDFLKKFLPSEFREFVSVVILNEDEDEINTWYYDCEDLIIILKVNWGFKKQEISFDVNVENFIVTIIDDTVTRTVDYVMFNDYLISLMTHQARSLSEIYRSISGKNMRSKRGSEI